MTDSTAITELEDFGWLGPAMQQLTELQRAFVRSLVTQRPGYGALTRAARAAGYCKDAKGNPANLCKHAHDLSRNERVIAAIAEESKKVTRIAHPEAVAALLNLIRDPSHKDHARAVAMLLDRADPAESRQSVEVVHRHLNADQEALEELRAARELGAPRQKLLELFGENGLQRLERLEAADNARRAEGAKVIEATEVEDDERRT
jgi:phage terminase small subunit